MDNGRGWQRGSAEDADDRCRVAVPVVFFVTAKPADVLAHLGAASGGGAGVADPPLRIDVRADGHALNGTPVPRVALDSLLWKHGAHRLRPARRDCM